MLPEFACGRFSVAADAPEYRSRRGKTSAATTSRAAERAFNTVVKPDNPGLGVWRPLQAARDAHRATDFDAAIRSTGDDGRRLRLSASQSPLAVANGVLGYESYARSNADIDSRARWLRVNNDVGTIRLVGRAGGK